MNKKELIRAVSVDTGCQIGTVSEVIESTFGNIAKSLCDGDKVVIKDFGVFQTTLRKEKVGRNIRTGESVIVPEHMIPDFKPGKLLKNMVKGG